MSKKATASAVTFQAQPVQEQEPEEEKLPLTTTETHPAPEKTAYFIFRNL
jgi:hypothetical protein